MYTHQTFEWTASPFRFRGDATPGARAFTGWYFSQVWSKFPERQSGTAVDPPGITLTWARAVASDASPAPAPQESYRQEEAPLSHLGARPRRDADRRYCPWGWDFLVLPGELC